jgi:hypothetical protein
LQQTVRSAAIPQVVAVDLRGQNFVSRGSFTETAALFFPARIDNGASPIRRESTRSKRKPRLPAACAAICAPNVPYSKQRDETEAYGKSWITVACCLCNTSPKTAAAIGSEAVH